MSTGPTNYFLLTYDLSTREVQVEEWHGDLHGATAAYTDREQSFEHNDDIEVVLVGADSLETIQVTHSHYFVKQTGDLVEELVRELLAQARAR